jgi:lactococcin 972 family bacteriocin
MNRFTAGAVAIGIMSALSLTPASDVKAATPISVPMDTTTNAGGGLWQYGVSGNVFSYYHHATKGHTATACDGRDPFKTCKQVAAVKNNWARAATNAGPRGNTAYWNTL